MQLDNIVNNTSRKNQYLLASWLSLIYILTGSFATPIGHTNIEISTFAFLQKGGDVHRPTCLYDLAFDDNVSDQTSSPADERLFLLDLYHATGGPKFWHNNTGWGDDRVVHHCKWFGIHCYKNSNYTKSIQLANNGLTGRLPNFWRLRNLQGLCLPGNEKMTGTISDVISSNMTRLRRLDIPFSGIYGEIPWDLILQLYNLEKIQLCCMKLHGNLPHDIDRLRKLLVLSLGENNIKGGLPLSIGNLTKLRFLDLEYMKLNSGEMSYFSNMKQLTHIHLTNCTLGGTIPNDFGKTNPSVIELRLHGNNLSGKIQNCFDGFEKIIQLDLSSNKLHGLLPTTFNKLQTLQILDVSNNNFTGFATNLSFNSQLKTLYLDQNIHLKIEGNRLLHAIQPCMHNLDMLLARNCGLKGTLSDSLWNFRQIMYIDLSHNNLIGKVPKNSIYFNMVYLFYFSIASNNFSGELPVSFFSPLKFLIYLDVRNNKYLKSKDTFPNMYMKVKYKEKLQRKKFWCPTVYLANSGGRIDMDPSYHHYSLCSCNKGYYGYRKYCAPCMKGGSCEVEASPSMINETRVSSSTNQNEITMNIKKGYWPCCGDFDNITKLVKCNQQEIFDDEICNPSGDCKCRRQVVNGQQKTACNSSCICRYGNKGRFCSQCFDGYYRRGSLCVPCPEFRDNFPLILILSFLLCFVMSIILLLCLRYRRRKSVVIILMFLFTVGLVVLRTKFIIPGWFFMLIFAVWILGLSDTGKNLKSFWSIAVFFFQSLDAMLSDANVWPTKIVLLKYQITNAFNFQISELSCSFSDAKRPEVSFAVILLLPISGICLIWLLRVLGKIFCTRNRNIASHRCKRWTLQILLFVYFPITAKTFDALFSCEHRDGLSYLKKAPWLDCPGTSYSKLLILGYVSLIVYVIGIPLFIFAPLLFKHLDKDGQVISQDIDVWLKPLYDEFKSPFRRYFRLVFLTRRLLLAVFLTIVPTTSYYQILGITLLLITFIIITLVSRPYKRYSEKFEFETSADVIVSIILLLSFVSLASLRLSTKFDNSLVWLLISMNLVVVSCCVLGILLLFVVNLWKSSNVQTQDVEFEPFLN